MILIVIYYLSAFDEEKNAIEKFGDDYKQYMKKAPRFNFIVGIVRLISKKWINKKHFNHIES